MTARRTSALVLVLGLAGAGTGCGSTGHGHPAARKTVATSQDERELVRLHQQVTRALQQHSHQAYGGLPANLAARQGDPDAILDATPQHPARTSQGQAIRLQTAGGGAKVIAQGPAISIALDGTDATVAPATFKLRFTELHGHLPIRTGTIGLVDEHDSAHVPPLAVKRVGRSVQVTIKATLPTGDGRIVYAPAGKPLATWDYTLETD